MNTVLIVVLAVLLIAAGPLLAIWSINTLFSLNIAYTFTNWVAMFLLLAFTQARVVKS